MPLASRAAGLLRPSGLARELRTVYELAMRPQRAPGGNPIEELPMAADTPEPPTGRLSILFASSRYDYGDPRRGLGVEETYFLTCLVGMGHRVVRCDPIALRRRYGHAKANQMLLESARDLRPDVLFTVMYKDEFQPDTISTLTREMKGRTIAWFSDDQWRLESYSLHWAPLFGLAVTTSRQAIQRYHEVGVARVHLSQWGCNHYLYRPTGPAPDAFIRVSFVGLPHGDRPAVIKRLRRSGIPVETWGLGWPNGRLGFSEMLRVFTHSPINLNLSNTSTRSLPQVKGRDFEVPGCGGFLITQDSEELRACYEPGREIEVYSDLDDLIDKVNYYLTHPAERQGIAHAGYKRTLAEHTMAHRLTAVLEKALA